MPFLWLIFFSFLFLFIQSLLYKKFGSSKILYTRYFEKPAVFEGEEVRLVEYIANSKILPMPWIRVESKIDSSLKFGQQFNLDIKHQQFHKSLFSLLPYTSVKRFHSVKCLKRGSFILSSAALSFGDLFGMTDNTKILYFHTELMVYPGLLPYSELNLPSHGFVGDTVVRRWIIDDPFLVSGVREYQPGDPQNRINWKMSAKTLSLKVRNHDFTADPKLMIYLNIESEEGMWDSITEPELIEHGIKIAATISQYAISQGISVGFKTNGCKSASDDSPVYIPPGSGFEQSEIILQALSKLIVKRSVTMHTLLEDDILNQATNTDIILISAYLNQNMAAQIDLLKTMGNAVEIYNLKKTANTEDGMNGQISA